MKKRKTEKKETAKKTGPKTGDKTCFQTSYYHISSVADRFHIHPQTLRLYEREGLLKPSRSCGNTRLYSDDDL
ncbi:MAG: MerR family DNA-binding transcriptional regulator, partial [Candidatus Aminicenantes bacterium]|nr:MerR family DNA-binding transcriptional regulator [Candidatus Aminicenantes bacterium]